MAKLHLPFDGHYYAVTPSIRAGAIRVHLAQVVDGQQHYNVSVNDNGSFVCSCPDRFDCEHLRSLKQVGVLPERN